MASKPRARSCGRTAPMHVTVHAAQPSLRAVARRGAAGQLQHVQLRHTNITVSKITAAKVGKHIELT